MTKKWNSPPDMSIDSTKVYSATVDTSEGAIDLELFANDAPMTVNNFVFLAKEGFYDGVTFHRIMKDFMVQTGDPTGTGSGGPGYKFQDEKVKRPYVKGTLAMANAGPNTNGSQFFIVHANDAQLPPSYTIFGKLTGGADVLDKIANVPVTSGGGREQSKPTRPISISSVKIEVKESNE